MDQIEILEAPSKRKAAPQVEAGTAPRPDTDGPKGWNGYEKILLRFSFIYFFIQAVPLDWKYYRDLLSIDWLDLQLGDIFYLARYTPRFFGDQPVFADWGVIALIAVVGTVVWSLAERRHHNYDYLYYVLRVIIRYRLAVALLAYGFIKFFPMQMPDPSISNLNTYYGDLTAWKIFSLSVGIVPGYESFLGLVEIGAALLLLYRKTASIGAFIIIPFTGNVVMSNLAYEGGEYVYSLLLVTFALFLLAFDARRLINLTSLERPTWPNRFNPVYTGWKKSVRIGLRSAFVFFFVLLYGYKSYAAFKENGFQYPQQGGLANAEGIYDVAEFRVNGQVLPASATDPVRWKDVVFERWATLSIRSSQAADLVYAGTTEIYPSDGQRNFEVSGNAGRHFYSYVADTARKVITLTSRTNAIETLVLNYSRPDDRTIVLFGLDSKQDSVFVTLQRIDKKYLLKEAAKSGRRRGLKL